MHITAAPIRIVPYLWKTNLFHTEFVSSRTEDASNKFVKGQYTVGKKIIDKVNDRMKTL